MKLLKILLILFFVNSFSKKMEQIDYLKKVGLFASGDQGKEDGVLRNRLLSLFKELTVKEYVDRLTPDSAMVIAAAAVKDEEFGAAYAQLVKNATDADRDKLKEKIDMALFAFSSDKHLLDGGIFDAAIVGFTLNQLCKHK